MVSLLRFFGKKGLFLRSAKGRGSNLIHTLASTWFSTRAEQGAAYAIAQCQTISLANIMNKAVGPEKRPQQQIPVPKIEVVQIAGLGILYCPQYSLHGLSCHIRRVSQNQETEYSTSLYPDLTLTSYLISFLFACDQKQNKK